VSRKIDASPYLPLFAEGGAGLDFFFARLTGPEADKLNGVGQDEVVAAI
jgi:hypothetical protein